MAQFIVAVLAVVFVLWFLTWYTATDIRVAGWITRKHRAWQAGLGYKKREKDAS